MYLLDTMVLELRKSRRDPSLTGWLEHVRPTDVFLSVVTIGEVEKGIAKQQRRNPAFAQRLTDWLDGVLRHYAARIPCRSEHCAALGPACRHARPCRR